MSTNDMVKSKGGIRGSVGSRSSSSRAQETGQGRLEVPSVNRGAQQISEALGTTGVDVIRGAATRMIGDGYMARPFLPIAVTALMGGRLAEEDALEKTVSERVSSVAGLLGLRAAQDLSVASLIRVGEGVRGAFGS